METKQTTGTITSATQHIKPCLIPQLLIRKFDPYRHTRQPKRILVANNFKLGL